MTSERNINIYAGRLRAIEDKRERNKKIQREGKRKKRMKNNNNQKGGGK